MLAQMRERDAEQVGGGFNASDQQQDRHVEHFAARQMFAIDLRLDEAADQVFAGIGGALVINLLEIGADCLRTAFDLGQSLRAVSRSRKCVGEGNSWSVRLDRGGRRFVKKKTS